MEKTPRNTKQKEILLQFLQSLKGEHITADEIIYRLKEQNTPVARATVYRFLAYLEEEGAVRKYTLTDGAPSCYHYIGEESTCQEHFHLMCQCCGQIVHFENQLLLEAIGSIASQEDIHIDGYKTVFYGQCPKCRKNTEV